MVICGPIMSMYVSFHWDFLAVGVGLDLGLL
jgi:hypothetical protein